MGAFAFGLLELALLGKQARRRAELLDYIDLLISNPQTKEQLLHQVIVANLWILGSEYSLLSSNKTMRTAVENHSKTRYTGKNASKRPDLLLLSEMRGRHLLIEFKRPSKMLDRSDESQAQQYRDDFGKTFHPMKIMLIGGSVDTKLRLNQAPDVEYISYTDLCARARAELAWLINNLVELPVERRSFFS